MYSEISKLIDYSEDTGLFLWKKRDKPSFDSRFAGKLVGYRDKDGYLVVVFKKKSIRLHRLAWYISKGVIPNEIDHINRDKTDNRISNLRECTRSENMQNIGLRRDNSSGFKGVGWCSSASKFRARCLIDGKRKTIGYSDTAEGAYELIKKSNTDATDWR